MCALPFFSKAAFAQTGPTNLNVSGILYLPSGSPVTQSSVNFRLEIWDKASTCILYSEEHLAQDLSQSKGGFALAVGRGTSPTNYLESSAVLTTKVFENTGAVAGGWPNCASGTNLVSGDERVIRVHYDLGGGFVAMSPDVPIASSAYALVADTLQGKRPADLIQVRDDVTYDLNQANVENVFSSTNYARLQQLLNPSAAIAFGSQRLTNLANPSAAQDAATKNYTDTNLAGQTIDLVDVAPGFGGGKVLTWDSSANKWVAQAPAIAGNAGGDLSGTYPNPTIAALAVGTSKLANDAVTSAKINSTGIATNRLLVTDATTGATVTYANCANNEILKYVTGTGWQCATVASLSAVTSVAGKSGAVILNAADISGLGTAAVRDIGVAATEVPELDAGGKLATSTIPLFAGDVTGAIGANIVTQIQGREIANTLPNLNEVLRWNGSRWEPQALTDNVGITALNGDVTASGTGLVAATINNGAVTTPKMFATPGANRLVATDNTTGATLTPFVCNVNETIQWTASGWACVSASTLVGSGFIADGGNIRGAAITIGTNDAQDLNLETNNIARLSIGTTGNVGVGTSSPSAKLSVSAAPAESAFFFYDNADVGDTSDGQSVYIYRRAAEGDSYLRMYHDQYGGSVIQASAALGINSGASGLLLNNSNWATTTIGPGGLNIGASWGAGGWNPPVRQWGYITAATAPKYIQWTVNDATDNFELTRQDANIPYFDVKMPTLFTGGNVGIGTTAPATLLEVHGPGNSSQGLVKASDNSDTDFASLDPNQGLILSRATGYVNNSKAGGSIGLRTTVSVTNDTLAMFIANNGDVGIGNSGPQRKLHVSGAVRFDPGALPGSPAAGDIVIDSGASNALKYHNGTSWVSIGSGTGDFLANGSVPMTGNLRLNGNYLSGDGGSEGVFVDAAGKVGIGLTAPTNTFHVFDSTTTAPMRVSTATAGSFVQFSDGGTGTMPAAGALGDHFTLSTSGLERMRITSAGRVGIGTSTPAEQLEVSSAASTTLRIASTASDANAGIELAARGGGVTYPATIHADWGGTLVYTPGAPGSGYIFRDGNGTDRVVIDGNGNLGVGATAPARLLHVAGPMRLNPSVLPGTPAAGDIAIDSAASNVLKYHNGTNWVSVGTGTGDFLANGTVPMTGNLRLNGHYLSGDGGAEGLFVTGTGDVGVGTTSPSGRLQVSLDQNGDTSARVSNYDGGAGASSTFGADSDAAWTHVKSFSAAKGGASQLYSTGTSLVLTANRATAPMTFETGGTNERMRIQADGKIGIGTTAPARLLHVAGPMRLDPATLPVTPAAGDIAIDSAASNALKYYNGSAWQSVATGGSSQWVTAGSDIYYNTGKVGIGTSAPGQKLSVNGRIETKGGMLFNQGGLATDNLMYLGSTSAGPVNASMGFFAAGVGSADSSSGPYFLARGNTFTDMPTQRGNIYFHAGNPFLPAAGEGALVFATGADVTRMKITNDGKIQMGDLSQISGSYGLEFGVGSSSAVFTGNQAGIYLPLWTLNNAAPAAGNAAGISFRTTSTTSSVQDTGAIFGLVTDPTGATFKSDLIFAPVNNAVSTERVRLTSGGNLGIGTTSPARLLNVAGPIRLDPSALPAAPAAGDIAIDSGAANALKYYNGSAWQTAGAGFSPAGNVKAIQVSNGAGGLAANNNVVVDTTNGRVGIGTTSPTVKLQVEGDTFLNGQTVVHNNVYVSEADFIEISAEDSSASHIQFLNGLAPVMTIPTGTSANAGNVGIGTTNPVAKLQVDVNSANNSYSSVTSADIPLVLRNASNTANSMSILSFVDTSAYGVGHIGAVITDQTNHYGSLFFATKGDATPITKRMVIEPLGNVGIATTAPRAKLDVNGVILGKPAVSNGTATINFGTGNLQYTSLSCQAFALHNLKDGGQYMFAVQGTTSGPCSFTGYSDAGSTAITVHPPPDLTDSISGKQSMFSIVVMGTHAYMTWVPGL